MSTEVIKDFLVGLGFEVDDKSFLKFNKGIANATVAVTAIGAAATVAAGLVTRFVSGIATDFDRISDLSIRVNSTAHEIMRLGFAADLTDSSMEAVASSVERLGRVSGEAFMGTGEGVEIFKSLGISVTDSNGRLKDTIGLMEEVGEKIKGLETGRQLAVLEKLGIERNMLRVLTEDMSGLKSEFDELYKSAGIDANKAAAASSDFVDTMFRLKTTFEAIKKAIGLKFMDRLRISIDSLRKFLLTNMPKIINTIAPVIDIILRISDAFIKVALRIGQFVSKIVGWFKKIHDATGGWSTAILAAAAAWKFLNLAFLASPVGKLVMLATALALIIDDFMTWREEGESAINWGGRFGKTLQVVLGIISAVTAAIVVSKAAMAAWAAVTAIASGALSAIRTAILLFNLALYANPLVWIIGAIIAAIGLIGLAVFMVIKHWDKLKEWFMGFFGWLNDKLQIAMDWIKGLVPDFLLKILGVDKTAQTAQLTPTTSEAANIAGSNQNVNQKTDIIVQGSGSPEATAKAVATQQNRVNADMARNMRGAVR